MFNAALVIATSVALPVVGAYEVSTLISDVNEAAGTIELHANVGILFGALSYPFLVLLAVRRVRLWFNSNINRAAKISVIWLLFQVVCFVSYRWGAEAYLAVHGYHECRDHEILRQVTYSQWRLGIQAWVLDPADCIVP